MSDLCCCPPKALTCNYFNLEDIHINPKSILFRKIELGTGSKRLVSLTNMGQSTIRFWLDSPSNKAFAISLMDIVILKPREFAVAEVLFQPTSITHYLDSFVIHIADQSDRSITQSFTVNLQAHPSIELKVPHVLAFGHTIMGKTLHKVFSLENKTEIDFEIETVCRGNRGDFCLCPNGTSALPAKSCLRYLLYFRPTRRETQTMEIGLRPVWRGIAGKQVFISVSGYSTVKLKFLCQEVFPKRHRFVPGKPNAEASMVVRRKPDVTRMNVVKKEREVGKEVLDRRREWIRQHEEEIRRQGRSTHATTWLPATRTIPP
ncbi:hypothetical protein RvY_00023-1 [Ramazzottius varieornatus]|uniref:HYDIN/VesB/CFA65-like Ig-like domain-containing protein n=1 Tax=Ramazzottius varieornatus TaxID=947166 RepID=A0A1D1UIQ5_RAMVA|nr:hypothetical protein RvY_00023-1 [Ramazzottius varieornatus]